MLLLLPTMADSAGLLNSAIAWFSSLLAILFFPQSSSTVVCIISGVFIVLGLAFILPILALVAFDIGLWVWRLYALNRRVQLRTLQRQRQLQREARQKREQAQAQLRERESHALEAALRQRARAAETMAVAVPTGLLSSAPRPAH